MTWHKDKRVDDRQEWKDFDERFPDFAADPRNVRLGMAIDGFNPFGNMSTSYSMWPVFMVPYNLPQWKCMKEAFCFMSLLIPGPSAIGRDIDIYLRPLIDELKEWWENGMQTYDSSRGQTFTMRACVLWTTNDFPTYGIMSGWSTKGYLACPICNWDISSVGLRSKIGYLGARRYLPEHHVWRRSKLYNGKNICDNLVGTIMGTDGKNKDTEKARKDLEDQGIRKELHLKRHANGSFEKLRAKLLGVLKRFVANKARPEGSIVAAYISEECTTFCSMYLDGIDTVFNRGERNDDGNSI
ncbi:hypothetical protein Vadar_004698 [Vaccinium darrowii]|uniref:Uncharacterized protein n=1 Tax=Vaccinium darrowii TaxID=229202 RepID=A0ACB7YD55_9ERIC|nr:hypothetical protein Vadar_004698 [Vaccinium darrowii]